MLKAPTTEELSKYFQEHKVREIIFSLIKAVYEHKPKDVPSFFVDYLHEHYQIEPKYRKCADDISWINWNKDLPIKKRLTPEKIRMTLRQFEKFPSVHISEEIQTEKKPMC